MLQQSPTLPVVGAIALLYPCPPPPPLRVRGRVTLNPSLGGYESAVAPCSFFNFYEYKLKGMVRQEYKIYSQCI